MKIKEEKDNKSQESNLLVRLTKGEELNYIQAEQLRQLPGGTFLPFSYRIEKDKTTVLVYPLIDTLELSVYLGANLSLTQFRALLFDIALAVEECGKNSYSYTELVFDPAYVYVDSETNHLRFAYLPIAQTSGKRTTVIDLLRHVATRAKFVCAENAVYAESLLDFLNRQTVFSLIDFRAFLDTGELKRNVATETPLEVASGALNLGAREKESSQPILAPSAVGVYDFVRAQSDTLSAQEVRSTKNLAEQVSFDVADVAATAEPTAYTGGASWGEEAAQTEAVLPLVSETANTSPGTPGPEVVLTEQAITESAAPAQAMPTYTKPPVSKVSTGAYYIVRASSGERYSLPRKRQTTIGRSKQCDIRIGGNTNISRLHARFVVDEQGCRIVDQGSANKTFVNGKSLVPETPSSLAPGDEILLADEHFRLEG